MQIQPYTVKFAEEILLDLRERLEQTRWPDEIEGAGWEYGFPAQKLHKLVDYWRDHFDWRAIEQRINSYMNFRADVDGIGIHFIQKEGEGPQPMPLLMLHGWPSTFYEMLDLLDVLSRPASPGDDSPVSFNIILPSIPGHGFSDKPALPAFEDLKAAEVFVRLMDGLGYDRFAIHAYDLGASIAGLLCLNFPEKVIGYHTSSPGNPSPYLEKNDPLMSQAERDYLAYTEQWAREEYGYGHLLSTRPQTVAYALNDSPAGLAAWILEKWQVWTAPLGDLENYFRLDDLLATVTIYWATQTINSANRYYYEGRHTRWPERGERSTVPHGVALPATQAFERPPREYVERLFPNILQWVDLPRGGHFLALQEPHLLAETISSFFRQLS
jgi:pimeloyl-ACP methyl ester carboxylesterase